MSAWNKSCASMAASGPENKKGPMNTRSVNRMRPHSFSQEPTEGGPMMSNKTNPTNAAKCEAREAEVVASLEFTTAGPDQLRSCQIIQSGISIGVV